MLSKKATCKTSKRSREHADSDSDDDFEYNAPGASADADDSDASSTSSQEEQGVRHDIQKKLEEVQGKIIQIILAKRIQFQQNLSTSFQSLNEKIEHILKEQQKEREKFYSEFSQMVQPLFNQWQIKVLKSGKEEENLSNLCRQQSHNLQRARLLHEANFNEAKKFSGEFMQNMKVLQEKHKSLLYVEKTEGEKEMDKLKRTIMKENQNQDLAAMERVLQSLLSEEKK